MRVGVVLVVPIGARTPIRSRGRPRSSRIGLPTVLASVDRSPIGDTAIRAVFGPPRTTESVGEGLRSYVRHLREQTGTLIAQ